VELVGYVKFENFCTISSMILTDSLGFMIFTDINIYFRGNSLFICVILDVSFFYKTVHDEKVTNISDSQTQ
jgi:hypothetical protein